ncbi:hypothetical protein BT69DRAFT_1285567 [Atractiella rhizophila]|nr:hypothetical protein BT69DRAFT_1285567 [Atractiella rhizophila]
MTTIVLSAGPANGHHMTTNDPPAPPARRQRTQRKSIGVNPALLQGDVTIPPAASPSPSRAHQAHADSSSGSIGGGGGGGGGAGGRRRSARLSGERANGAETGNGNAKVRLGKRKSEERPATPVEGDGEDEGEAVVGKGKGKGKGKAKPPSKRARLSDPSPPSPPPTSKAAPANEEETSNEFVFTKQPLTFEDPDEGGGGRKGKRKAPGTSSAARGGRAGAAKRGKTTHVPSSSFFFFSSLPHHSPSTSDDPAEFSQEVTVAETPKIRRNAALRGEGGPKRGARGGNDGGVGKGERRSSLDLRGKRASSIGSGFDVPPHPAIDDASLYRHLNITDPPAIKFRALVAWGGMRKRDNLSTIPPSTAMTEKAKKVALKAIEGHLERVTSKKVDLSWLGKGIMPVAQQRNLPPNPSDASNLDLRDQLIKIYNKIDEESKARNATVKTYQDFSTRLSALASLPSSSASAPTSTSHDPETIDKKTLLDASNSIDPSLLQPAAVKDVDSATRSAEKLVALLQSAQGGEKEGRKRRKSRLAPVPEEDSEKSALGTEVAGLVDALDIQALTFNNLVHRLNQALEVSSIEIEETNKKVKAELEAITSGGLPDLDPDVDVGELKVKKKVDPMALMRAITREDSGRGMGR